MPGTPGDPFRPGPPGVPGNLCNEKKQKNIVWNSSLHDSNTVTFFSHFFAFTPLLFCSQIYKMHPCYEACNKNPVTFCGPSVVHLLHFPDTSQNEKIKKARYPYSTYRINNTYKWCNTVNQNGQKSTSLGLLAYNYVISPSTT